MSEVVAVDTGYYRNGKYRPMWRPGEVARLSWNGYPQIPRYMDGWRVTVVRPTRNTPTSVPLYRVSIHNWRGNVRATKIAGAEYRTVRADQLMDAEA